MLGSIIGDIVGSAYEFNNIKTKDFLFFGPNCNFTDDTIMTIAVADWLLRDPSLSHKSLEESMVWLASEYPCPKGGYGGMFAHWLENPEGDIVTMLDPDGSLKHTMMMQRKPYNSCGNGSAMRVSAVGWMADTLEETLRIAELSASITHNHPEGIKGAQATAMSIFMARKWASKREIALAVEERFGYDLSMTVAQLQRRYSWKGIDEKGNGGLCQESVPQAIICALEGESYEDAVRNAVSIGGDSDTIACIAGGIAEALYGLPEHLYDAGFGYLPEEFAKIVTEFERRYGSGFVRGDGEQRLFTPERISSLRANEVFVFGSNLDGRHGGGAARTAYNSFGAVWGQGVGMQGQCYAIPTMQGGVETIKPYVDDFVEYARNHSERFFWVTRIGCGIAGFRDEEMAPLFVEALELRNVALPRSFVSLLK